ncbi:MAG: heme-binding domain-containing protein [Myxococcota bacterium]
MRLIFPFIALSLLGCRPDSNPPVTQEIQWVDAETEALARRACYDCHSNETEWKAMHALPFIKGWVTGHVLDGRCALNFSEWDQPQPLATHATGDIMSGRMPLEAYVKHRKQGRLTLEERITLAEGLARTMANDPPPSGGLKCSPYADTGL